MVLVGGVAAVAFAATSDTPSPPTPSEDEAVNLAMEQLGSEASTLELVQFAYRIAYPEGPIPPSEPYQRAWDSIGSKVLAATGRPPNIVVPPVGPTDTDDSAERVAAWLDDLTNTQRAEAREIIGRELWDPLETSARANDDLGTKAGLLAIKRTVENLVEKNKLSALSLYNGLNGALGEEKLNAFFQILDDTVGAPNLNPARYPAGRPAPLW